MSLGKGDVAAYLKATAQPGWTVIDVGANEGELTQVLCEAVGPSGHVIAIEPDPRCHAALDAMAAKFSHLDVETFAAGAHDGHQLLYRESRTLLSSLYPVSTDAALHPSAPNIEVQVRRLDRFVVLPELVKVDVQGGEMCVLQGATGMLSICPNWVIELWPHGLEVAGSSAKAVIEWMHDAGLEPTEATAARTPIEWAVLKEYASRQHKGHEHINVAWMRPLTAGTKTAIDVIRVAA